jgi:hypothetical protein
MFKNKRYRKQQKYDMYLTESITHEEINPFDDIYINIAIGIL